MRTTYGFKSAPRSLVYLPESMGERVVWHQQKLILRNDVSMLIIPAIDRGPTSLTTSTEVPNPTDVPA